MTIQQLRNDGYKVRVLHNRLYKGKFKWQRVSSVVGSGPIDPDTKGGSTQIVVDSPSGEHYDGIALCSKKDNYNKKLGVRIALGRCNIEKALGVQEEQTNE